VTSYTPEEYEELRKAIAQGASRVQYGDRIVQYRSLEDMKALLGEMEVSLGIQKSSGKLLRVRYQKGL